MGNIVSTIFVRPTFIAPDSITVVTGGTPVGTVTDMQTPMDGNIYDLPEGTGTPGFDLEIDFIDIVDIYGIVLRGYYAPQNSVHYAQLLIHNYSGGESDDTVVHIEPSADHNYRTIMIPDGTDFIDGSGNAQLTLYHPQAGNASHDMYIDYVALLGTQR
jgi:hypothetical protein